MRESTKNWLTVIHAVILLVVLGVGGWLYYWWVYSSQFPYGWSHSCDKALMNALLNYAETHGGAFPASEATPEASLSLLYPEFTNAEVLRGKTVSFDVVESILKSGGRLGPDTCGWHYVEGLRSDDDPRLALFWDKVGLGHNGQLLPDGGHKVFLVKGKDEHIPEVKWSAFLKEQEKLLAECKKKRQQHKKK